VERFKTFLIIPDIRLRSLDEKGLLIYSVVTQSSKKWGTIGSPKRTEISRASRIRKFLPNVE